MSHTAFYGDLFSLHIKEAKFEAKFVSSALK